jgi:hypothetical protein
VEKVPSSAARNASNVEYGDTVIFSLWQKRWVYLRQLYSVLAAIAYLIDFVILLVDQIRIQISIIFQDRVRAF